MARLVRLVRALSIAALIAASVVGCATEKARVVPIADLPAQKRAVLVDYGRGGAAWEARREEVRADPALQRFLVDNLVVELVRGFQYGSVATSGGRSAAYERAQAELVRFADASAPLLAALLAAPDDLTVFCALDTLKRIGRPAVLPTADQLAHPDWKTRLRAAEALAELPHGAAGEARVFDALVGALGDGEWIVRAQAARTLGERGARARELAPTRRALVAALADEDPAVVGSAAQALGRLGDPAAVGPLVERLAGAQAAGDLRVVRAAQGALVGLTGRRDVRSVDGWRRVAREHAEAPDSGRRP